MDIICVLDLLPIRITISLPCQPQPPNKNRGRAFEAVRTLGKEENINSLSLFAPVSVAIPLLFQ